MKQRPFSAEFLVPPMKPPAPKPPPGAKAERQRQRRAAQKARDLALAYWIDSLIRSGEVADLATVGMLTLPRAGQEITLAMATCGD